MPSNPPLPIYSPSSPSDVSSNTALQISVPELNSISNLPTPDHNLTPSRNTTVPQTTTAHTSGQYPLKAELSALCELWIQFVWTFYKPRWLLTTFRIIWNLIIKMFKKWSFLALSELFYNICNLELADFSFICTHIKKWYQMFKMRTISKAYVLNVVCRLKNCVFGFVLRCM